MNGLELLFENKAGIMQIKDKGDVSYGVKRIEGDFLVYYTGKGLREMWKENETELAEKLKEIENSEDGEEKLIQSGHLAKIPLSDIIKVIS